MTSPLLAFRSNLTPVFVLRITNLPMVCTSCIYYLLSLYYMNRSLNATYFWHFCLNLSIIGPIFPKIHYISLEPYTLIQNHLQKKKRLSAEKNRDAPFYAIHPPKKLDEFKIPVLFHQQKRYPASLNHWKLRPPAGKFQAFF